MPLVRMNATVREQADEVERAVVGLSGLDGGHQHWIAEQRAVGNCDVNARDIHVYDAAGAQIQVANFGVAHLAVRQANEVVAGPDECVWEIAKKAIVIGLAC